MRFPTIEADAHTVVVLEPRLRTIQRKFIYLWAELRNDPGKIEGVISRLDAFVSLQIHKAAQPPV